MAAKIKFEDLETAFHFVSYNPYGENSAVVRKDTGEILWFSETDGEELDDPESIPDAVWEAGDAVELPHKNDLDLGRDLAFQFAADRLPEHFGRVVDFFHAPGAYRRFKDLLEYNDLLDDWHEFENEAEVRALRQWCEEEGIELVDPEE